MTTAQPGRAAGPQGSSVDPGEVGRFDAMAADWWNPHGSMKALHRLNPLRLRYVRDRIAAHFGLSATALKGLAGLSLVDIGCGAGLLSEPLARLGAGVVGIDAAPANIEAARRHAAEAGLAVDYRLATSEELAAGDERYDVVLAMEIVEHVAAPAPFLRSCAGLVKPGGLLFVSTLNRTMKAYALAILGAERVLRWLPRGTHDWNKFVTPEEIAEALAQTGLAEADRTGVAYNPLLDEWRLSRDLDVNYMMVFAADPERAYPPRSS
ncbi:bifunctional 2-polyprenyl-6-hydroxyphenol methylase/3-demethylubiquinol 3-O-methyltransferase UbiG [Labrys monachus]|uniref:Ubiquinone biosynthesis O-methyltransferase n=1 Tax=Labrys monachus TaxID=217067 RepID=A0ABU0FNZ4_9HYPH|nr:bifunctional 2-polyprenyl-6-hydroxyphenol methylase/3-demethylubiquinol 3-O-methyltransferase UbiG [Labrys monachus]MDQ0396342.1 2-polyprenyl-6-hydroxyphenyl methylase/3-demethylubiquinone-9 3-methyltransferase [Labrys monachus]